MHAGYKDLKTGPKTNRGTVGHTLLCIVDWSKAMSQKHAYDNIYDRQLSRIEFFFKQ
jgi:hypothetical protein